MILLALALAAVQQPECDDRNGDLSASECWYKLGQTEDAKINQLWPKAIAVARRVDRNFEPSPRRDKPSSASDLLASQRAWLKFRDAQCALESDYADGGSLQNVIYSRCQYQMTRDRILQLQATVLSFEGN